MNKDITSLFCMVDDVYIFFEPYGIVIKIENKTKETQVFSCFIHFFTKEGIVKNTTVFQLSKIFSRFGRKQRFYLHQNCVTNSIYTRTQTAIVDCEELGWSAICKEIGCQKL